MIVFTVPIKECRETTGKRKMFVSAREVKMFEVIKYFDNYPNVQVRVGNTPYMIPYSSMGKAEKYVREAIEAIMRDEDYEFPDYEEQ